VPIASSALFEYPIQTCSRMQYSHTAFDDIVGGTITQRERERNNLKELIFKTINI
jgi:hypothetical protein